MNRITNKLLGELLVERGCITRQQCDEALAYAGTHGTRMGDALLTLGYTDHGILSHALGEQFGLTPVQLDFSMIDVDLVQRFPLDLLRRHVMIPLVEMGEDLVLVVSDPQDARGIHAVSGFVPGSHVSVQVGDHAQIQACLNDPIFSNVKAAGYVPTPLPSPWMKDEPVTAGPDSDLIQWIITSALQRPECDLLLRSDGAQAQAMRRSTEAEAECVDLLHTFSADAFSTLLNEIWSKCTRVSHTIEDAGMWSVPLRFEGKRYLLEVVIMHENSGTVVRIKPLELQDVPADSPTIPVAGAVAGSVAVVLYEERKRLESLLTKFIASQPQNQIVVLFQEATRRLFPHALAFPGLFTDTTRPIAALGATCVIFDFPISADELARARHAVMPFPALVMCAPVNTRNESLPGRPDGLELRPKISPDAVEVIRLYKPDVIYLGSLMDDVKEMSAYSALDYLGVNK